jgi:hypothetical protein
LRKAKRRTTLMTTFTTNWPSSMSQRPIMIGCFAFPESVLAEKREIKHPELPFTIRVKDYFPNSWFGNRENAKKVVATDGIGARPPFSQQSITAKMNDENKPAALLEIATPNGVLGSWTVSTWLTKTGWSSFLKRNVDQQFAPTLETPQTFKAGDRTFQIALRPIRYYKDHSVQLLDFKHDRYMGTAIPKNFSSQIRLQNPKTREDREVVIYMNNPLRYGGETYYQGSFEPGDTTSILHVVRNPAWLGPYISCSLVGLGLFIQFMMHLIGFVRKNRNSPPESDKNAKRPARRKDPLSATPSAEKGSAYELSTKRRTA